MTVAASLWVFAVLLWIILIYTFFASVTVAEPKPSLEVAINGSWLLVSWEVCTIFQPLIGGSTLFSGRQERGGFPLLDSGGIWSLGMYTASTSVFANATGMPFLLIIPRISVYIAMLA
jgi:hypothetical protein